MKVSYENRFIAFLDILGFKNWVDKTVDDEDVFNTIKSGIDYISREREELYHGRYSDIRINDKEISVFSDSIPCGAGILNDFPKEQPARHRCRLLRNGNTRSCYCFC